MSVRDGPASGARRVPAPPEVKICGLRRADEASAAAEAGAAYIGLVFADGPRRVEPEGAARIVEALARGAPSPRGPTTETRQTSVAVGVFVDETPEEIIALRDEVEFGIAQLHGREPPSACGELQAAGLEVWKALRPRWADELLELVARYRRSVDAFLFEGYSPRAAGGTGTRFPLPWWDLVPHRPGRPRRILSGGLTPDSVAAAVRAARPDVVDVSSGVESAPGRKDPEHVRRFIAETREAFVAASSP